MRCLCDASTDCNLTKGCIGEHCGPFLLSRDYWSDAGRFTTQGDMPGNPSAYVNCANDYTCSSKTVENYMMRFAKDCNNDRVVDCLDYALIHTQGPVGCTLSPLKSTESGKQYLERYHKCRAENEFLIDPRMS